jgi:hypothetical protein
MDVVNPCKDALVMVNKFLREEKPCNACGPTMILIVYGPTNGLREFQKEVRDCCKYLNLKYASNPSSHGIVTHSDINDTYLEG